MIRKRGQPYAGWPLSLLLLFVDLDVPVVAGTHHLGGELKKQPRGNGCGQRRKDPDEIFH